MEIIIDITHNRREDGEKQQDIKKNKKNTPKENKQK
jgi:hypothetical protein